MKKSEELLGKRSLKLREAAYLLACSPSTLRRAIRRGELRARRWMRHITVSREELERFAGMENMESGGETT
jgi:excisionase family DNA binding protein